MEKPNRSRCKGITSPIKALDKGYLVLKGCYFISDFKVKTNLKYHNFNFKEINFTIFTFQTDLTLN